MKEPLIDNTKAELERAYMQLKKYSELVKKDYMKVIDETFTEENWRKDSKKINNDLKNFDKFTKDITNKLKILSDAGKDDDENIIKISSDLNDIKKNIFPMVKSIKDKIINFDSNFEMGSAQEGEEDAPFKNQELVMDLTNNQEILEKRRKELENIHQTAAILKETTDKIAIDLEKQGAILNDVEGNVLEAKENAEKSKQEIVKADELSRGNRKRMICLILIILLAIGGIAGILIYAFTR